MRGGWARWSSITKRNPALTGARGLCPRCQQGHLFSGFLKLAPRCEICGLHYSFADPADGPAFFSMFHGGVPRAGFRLVAPTRLQPAIFCSCRDHAAAHSWRVLRPLKGWLSCSQHFHKAQEGSIDREFHAQQAERRRGTEAL
ncbi:hypothetical protein CK224_08490 [Mesorhizobium sp. WSM3862]|nr:hypothetical protein CK224_08490 [Mesorhizobium sp. WSM3862]